MKKKACNLLWVLWTFAFVALWMKANTIGNIGTCALSLCVVILSRILPSMRRKTEQSSEITTKVIAALIGIAVGWNFYHACKISL